MQVFSVSLGVVPGENPLDDPRLTTAGLFFEASSELTNALARDLAEECDLPFQWFEVMLRLARSPGHRLRMCDLAAQVALSPSGLTRAVDRLEQQGLVTRESCLEDRRVDLADRTELAIRPDEQRPRRMHARTLTCLHG